MNLKLSLQNPTAKIINLLAILIIVFQPVFARASLIPIIEGTDYIFCIDGGGSKTSLQVLNSKLEVVDLEYEGGINQARVAGPTNISDVGFEKTKETLRSLLSGLTIGPEKQELKGIKKKSLICGLAGLTSNADKAPLLKEMFESFGFESARIDLSSDVELAKQLIDQQGAILIAGAGSICFSKVAGIEKRIGGYGYILGDEGSGFYVGKLALNEAFQSAFERGEPFILTAKMSSQLNVESITDAIKAFYTDKTIAKADVAKLAPLVFEGAFKQNDQRCKAIVAKCATKLADHLSRAVQGSTQAHFPVYLIGGIFKNENKDQFIELIRAKVNYAPGLKFINIAQENIATEVIKGIKNSG